MPGTHPQKNIGNKYDPYIQSRFGAIPFNKKEEFHFPQGIVGFPNGKQYILTAVPGYKDRDDFVLLQCTTHMEIAFIVMPLGAYGKHPPLQTEDVKPYLQALELEETCAQVFAIVSLGNGIDRSEITINLRAPLLFDMKEQKAWQIILDNPTYDIAHPLLLHP